MKTRPVIHIDTFIELDDETYNVEFDVTDYIIAYDGIGAYECHGYKGYNKGLPYIEEFKISNLKFHDETLIDHVINLLHDDYELQILIDEVVLESITDDGPDDDWREDR